MSSAEQARFTPRFTRGGTFAVTLLALILSPSSRAFAQSTDSYVAHQGFQAYEGSNPTDLLLSRPDRYTFPGQSNSEVVQVPGAERRTPATAQSGDTDAVETIVVTAQPIERGFTERPEFERNTLANLGLTTIINPENEGLGPYAYIRPEDREGWSGVNINIFGAPDSDVSFGLNVKRAPGVGGRIRF